MTKPVKIEALARSTATASPRSARNVLRSGLALLAAGAAVEAVARLLIVPWYDEPDRYIDAIVDQRGLHVAGAAISFIAAIIITAGLTRLWASGVASGRLISTSLTLALIFPLGLAGVAAYAFLTGSLARDSDPAAAIATWQDAWNTGGADIVWYAAMLGSVALVVALVGLARSRALLRVPAALIALGALTTAVTSEGPVTAVLVAAALLLSAGAGWAAAKTNPTSEPTNPTPPSPAS